MPKRIILTRQQLNEVLNEVTGVYKSTIPGAAGVVDAIKTNLPQINKLNGIDGSSVPQTLIQTPTVNGQDADEKPVVQIDTKGDPSQASTVISQNSDLENALNTNKVNGLVTEKNKSFSKRQIEEARLRKMREEGIVISKRALSEGFLKEWEGMQESFTDGNSIKISETFNSKFYGKITVIINANKDLSSGLYEGDWAIYGDELYSDNFGRTYIGTIKIQDNQVVEFTRKFSQNQSIPSPVKRALKMNGFSIPSQEIYESKIKIKPENKGKFNATKKRTGKSTEELTHSKNPLTRKRAIFAQNAKKWKKK